MQNSNSRQGGANPPGATAKAVSSLTTKDNPTDKKSQPDFKTDLRRGEKGEAEFKAAWPTAVKNPKHEFDFYLYLKIEVKTDDMALKTGNLFIERWSDVARQKPGGPWQYGHCHFLVFRVGAEEYWFRPADLIKFVETNNYRLLTVNKKEAQEHWQTQGFAVPIKHLLDIRFNHKILKSILGGVA